MGIAESGPEDRLHHQGVPDPQPHRRRAGRDRRQPRQHGPGPLDLAHVRHRQGLGLARRPGRDRISGAARRRPRSTSSNMPACRSAAPTRARSTSAPFGGMMQNMGEGPPAQRTCAAADRTGHAMLHALYQQSLKYDADFFIEYFALDLIMEDGDCRGVIALCMEDGSDPPLPRPRGGARDRRLWPRLFLGDLGAYLHRRRQCDGAARRPAAAGHGVRPVPPDRHLRRRRADHRGRARRGRLSDQLRRRALHGALCPVGQGPGAAATSCHARWRWRSARAAASARTRTISASTSTISIPRCCTSGCPGITETGKIFAGVDLTRQPLPVTPTVHYNMGGIPTNYHGEVVTLKDGNPDTRRARPVRGRRGGLRLGPRRQPARLELPDRPRRVRPRTRPCGSPRSLKPQHAAQRRSPKGVGGAGARPPRPFPQRQGRAARPPRSALEMQRTMQDALRRVPRPEDAADEGVAQIDAIYPAHGRCQGHRPQPDLEHRSGRDARARQSARARRW